MSRDLKDIFQNFNNDKLKRVMNSQLYKNIRILNSCKKNSLHKSQKSQPSENKVAKNSNQFSLPNSGSGDSISDSNKHHFEKLKLDMMRTKKRRWTERPQSHLHKIESSRLGKIADQNNLKLLIDNIDLLGSQGHLNGFTNEKLTKSEVNFTSKVKNTEGLSQNLRSLRNSQKLLTNRDSSKLFFKVKMESHRERNHRRGLHAGE